MPCYYNTLIFLLFAKKWRGKCPPCPPASAGHDLPSSIRYIINVVEMNFKPVIRNYCFIESSKGHPSSALACNNCHIIAEKLFGKKHHPIISLNTDSDYWGYSPLVFHCLSEQGNQSLQSTHIQVYWDYLLYGSFVSINDKYHYTLSKLAPISTHVGRKHSRNRCCQ